MINARLGSGTTPLGHLLHHGNYLSSRLNIKDAFGFRGTGTLENTQGQSITVAGQSHIGGCQLHRGYAKTIAIRHHHSGNSGCSTYVTESANGLSGQASANVFTNTAALQYLKDRPFG